MCRICFYSLPSVCRHKVILFLAYNELFGRRSVGGSFGELCPFICLFCFNFKVCGVYFNYFLRNTDISFRIIIFCGNNIEIVIVF